MILQFLRAFFPQARNDIVKGMADAFPDAVKKWGITVNSLATAMGQVKVESGGLTVLRENLNYSSANRIMEVYGVGRNSAAVTASEAGRLVKNPKALAMRVYGTGRKATGLGNKTPEDGWTYRGAGPIQLTGRYIFVVMSELTGVDFVNNPDYAADPRYFWDVIFGFFKSKSALRDLGQPITNNSITHFTRVVNGGRMHLNERISATYDAKKKIVAFNVFGSIENAKPKAAVVAIHEDEMDAEPDVVNNEPDVQGATDAGSQEVENVAAKVEATATPQEVENVVKDSDMVDVNTASALPSNPEDAILARYGDKDNLHVRTAQESLHKLNYWTGAVDGDYGALTRDSLFAFQANNGFPLEAILRLKHIQRFATAAPRSLSDTRQSATENSPELHGSVTLRMARWIKRVGIGALSIIGIQVTPDATGVDLMSKLYDKKSEIAPMVQSVTNVLGTKYVIMAGVAIVAVAIIVMSKTITKERVDRYNDGSTLNR